MSPSGYQICISNGFSYTIRLPLSKISPIVIGNTSSCVKLYTGTSFILKPHRSLGIFSFYSTDFSFLEPILWAMTIVALIAISTGTNCALFSPLASIDLITPLPAPTNSPIGPFRLSTHPGSGSFMAGTTKIRHSSKKFIFAV